PSVAVLLFLGGCSLALATWRSAQFCEKPNLPCKLFPPPRVQYPDRLEGDLFMRLRTLALLIASALPATLLAQQSRPATTTRPTSEFALTVYSTADPATFDPKQLAQQRLANPYNAWQFKLPGYGVVRETRPIELKEGENEVRFTDVAAGIDPTTVAF